MLIGNPSNNGTPTELANGGGIGFYTAAGGDVINELGFWVAPEDTLGTMTDHTITLYGYVGSNTYQDLAQVTIPAGTMADSTGYAWVSIPTMTLPNIGQGADYYAIAATGEDYFLSGTSTNVDSAFGAVTGNGTNPVSGSPEVNLIGGTEQEGPNIGFASTPEPASLGLLAIGTVSLLAHRCRV